MGQAAEDTVINYKGVGHEGVLVLQLAKFVESTEEDKL